MLFETEIIYMASSDAACQIAQAINTSVEYLVTGQNSDLCTHSAAIADIALTAGNLNSEGIYLTMCSQ